MNAVIYARYSSDNQREESIDGQIRECTDYARRENIKIVGTYIDRALSARTADRPDFQRMIHDSEKRLFDAVIVWKLDRFSRDRYDSAFYKRQLRKNGVKLISATEAISDGPEGIILEALLEGMNEYYSAELSVKIKRGHKENALKCMSNGGQLAYGYRVNPETRLFEPDPVTAPIVKEIFARYANGDQMKNIVSDLNARGLKPYYSDQFYVSTLGVMLKNRKYIGEYRYGEVVIPDGVPAIIDEEIFEKVQRRLAMNKKAPAKGKAIEEYLLSTKLYCGVCGGLMVGESGRSRNGSVHFYYKCGNAKRRKGCKRRKAIRKHWIEKLVVIFTVNNVLQDDVIDRIADAEPAEQPADAHRERHRGNEREHEIQQAQLGLSRMDFGRRARNIGPPLPLLDHFMHKKRVRETPEPKIEGSPQQKGQPDHVIKFIKVFHTGTNIEISAKNKAQNRPAQNRAPAANVYQTASLVCL